MIEVKVYTGTDARDAAKQAISAALYVPGWTLHDRLRRVQVGRIEGAIALAYKDSKPVAVVLVRASDGFTAAFVRKPLRRQGIASKCIIELKAAGVEPRSADEGVDGSLNFWDTVSIPTHPQRS